MLYLIDITGTCNLRCPSCPVGNFKEKLSMVRPKGFMPPALFQRLGDKARNDCAKNNLPLTVALYNWGEPLIHPQIDEILAYLYNENIHFGLSSNFNTQMDLSLLLHYPPDMLRITVSGFAQEMYQKGHKGGDIELVKKNLIHLRKIMDENTHNLNVHIFYLIYKDNCDDNIKNMYDFTQKLNFGFFTGLAYFMPLENMIYSCDENDLNQNDKAVLNRLCFSTKEVFEINQNNPKSTSCDLLEKQVVLNYDGTVPLCCGVYSPEFAYLADYLKIELTDLQHLRRQNPLCKICLENKLDWMMLQQPIDVYNLHLRRKQKEWNTPYWVNLQTFKGEVLPNPLVNNPYFQKE